MHAVEDGTRPHPSVAGSLGYLLLNFPVGLAGFVAVVTLAPVGLSTAIVWLGVPVLAVLILGTRAAARFERARAHALLGTYVASPYRPLPAIGWRARWRARLLDGATWRDLGYFVVLFPIGTAEFVVLVTCWSVGLGLTTLPTYVGYLPEGTDLGLVRITSAVQALPWAVAGVLVLALSVVLTRELGAVHARFARLALGPGPRARRLAETEPDLRSAVA
ncbi:sensor domain-containing protein [Amycolatopsis alkalitolerans]|uniref:Two-component system sensor kinase n=1 Tax=Amycolatopsis alkalitolerans TaxID=2547244 RepID=A0A5C4LX38_9PSEU|nr:sensor domain-containing protein [Amycolatopsis alkalitolerans]TNC21420.1 two-component system sensor kinase [Amycolatopsis alkalitolerans]